MLNQESVNELNTTHTVKFEMPPSRFLRFMVGIAVLFAVWRCYGQIRAMLMMFWAPEDSGLGSVTAVVLPLLIEFVIFLGSAAIFVVTIGWSVVSDVIGGLFATVGNLRARSVAVQQATVAATEAAGAQAGAYAGAAAGASAVAQAASPPHSEATFPELVQRELLEQRNTIQSQAKVLADLSEAVSKLNTGQAIKAPARSAKGGGM